VIIELEVDHLLGEGEINGPQAFYKALNYRDSRFCLLVVILSSYTGEYYA